MERILSVRGFMGTGKSPGASAGHSESVQTISEYSNKEVEDNRKR
jgi:hypothetical protein